MSSGYNKLQQLSSDYQVIEQALDYVGWNYRSQPSLENIAEHVGYSAYHFQRLFTRWVGISPKRFLQYVTKEHAKELLAGHDRLLDVAYSTGLSGPGRLHDLFITCEAVTPGEYKNKGKGLEIEYGFYPTPFGECFIASTERGICSMMFVDKSHRELALDELRRIWVNAELKEKSGAKQEVIERLFLDSGDGKPIQLHLHLYGTNFQIKVWEALLRIPPGYMVSYQTLAEAVDKPKAARAVGNAVAANHISLLIPCHRVIRKMGEFGSYRWGPTRKKAILGWEMARYAA